MQEDAPFVVVLTCDWNILMIMCKLARTFNVNVFQKKFKAFRAKFRILFWKTNAKQRSNFLLPARQIPSETINFGKIVVRNA